MTLLIDFVLLPLLLLVVCAAIVIWLLLVLRVSTVTTCRGCGENLWGMRKVRICPTCGGDRRVPREKRGGDGGRGRMRRRGRAVALLAPVTLMSGLWFGLGVAVVAGGPRFNPYKPAWLLIEQAIQAREDLDGQSRMFQEPNPENKALTELTSRIGQLDAGAVRAIADHALMLHQNDVAGGRSASHGPWFEFIEFAHEKGNLPAEQWDRYLHQGVDQSLSIDLRQQVRRGDPLVMAIHFSPFVAAKRIEVSYETDHIPTIAGRKGGTPEPGRATIGGDPDETAVDLPADLVASLLDGPQNTDVTATLNVRDIRQPRGPPIYSKTVVLHGIWALMPATSPALVVDNTVRKTTLLEMATATNVRITDAGHTLGIGANYSQWAPYPFAYRVYVRCNGQELEVGRDLANGGVLAAEFHYPDAASPAERRPLPSKVDVIIRANEEDAVRTIRCTKTWHGDIVIPDVSVGP